MEQGGHRVNGVEADGLPVAQGLLLDFGGVIVETSTIAGSIDSLASYVADLLAKANYAIPHQALVPMLTSGIAGLKAWRDAASFRREPAELSHREAVGDFLTASLPEGARTLLLAEATALLTRMVRMRSEFTLRPGITQLLDLCEESNIPVGIVSNAVSGRAHRDVIDELGLTDRFTAQVYSDEVGIRKPNPEILTLGAGALGLEPSQVWYVGDTYDRDVVAAKQAGVAGTVVTRSKRPFSVPKGGHQPDLVLDSPAELLPLIRPAAGAAAQTAQVRSQAEVETSRNPALLIDHGGVISITTKNPEGVAAFASEVARRIGEDPDRVLDAIRAASEEGSVRKKTITAEYLAGDREDLPELQPDEFFGRVAKHVGHEEFFRAEAHDLMFRYAKLKSSRVGRDGMVELMKTCRELGVVIVVVSNTVSGRTVRHHCERYGLDPYIAAYVCSDEVNGRKPAPEIFAQALSIANADPQRTWFLGDKPVNDAEGASNVGIAHPVLISGGSTPREDLMQFGSATVVDSPIELKDLIVSVIGRK